MEAVMTQHIVMTPGFCGGRARIDGTRIRVMDVVRWYHHQQMTVPEIAEAYPSITEAQIFAALAFYADNRELIEHDFVDSARIAEEIRRQIEARAQQG